MIVSQTDFAKILGVSRQAVSKAIKDGVIFLDDGKIDTENAGNTIWATNSPAKSKCWKAWCKNVYKVAPSMQGKKKDPDGKENEKEKEPVKAELEKDIPKSVKVETPTVEEHLSPDEISNRKQKVEYNISKEKLVKLLIENAVARSELVMKSRTQSIEERSWNNLIIGAKNVGNIIVMDLTKRILAKGGSTNDDFFFVENLLMDMIESSRQQKIKELRICDTPKID